MMGDSIAMHMPVKQSIHQLQKEILQVILNNISYTSFTNW